MHAKDILIDAYSRIQEEVHAAVEGLGPDDLNARPAADANSVTWLVWHLTRVQDDHLADASGLDQVWLSQGWEKRFGLGLPRHDTGFGHSSAKVAKVRVDSGDLLTGYHDAVHEQTLGYVRGLAAKDFERIVDERWDPPVSLGVRLVSVLADALQHVGQAAYVRGLLQRADS
ncbi:mycothiol transferase [Streptomyces sp. DSM 40750]|uniref:mycothiol transferase n=1 Tax=Streptomyces sp. DSM 40750 TaxID=2801030 RepID=UPI00214AC224|nr:DinB family protein [Streptomyces sp. DSM 40750]UUU19512.1 DinB family protein [Streptomyces sp. DSM 40750]UUU27144.1 DinB family protein [Streptomyces sp. DSM 40750]